MSASAPHTNDAVRESELRAAARNEAVRALAGYNSPLSGALSSADLDALRLSAASENAGIAGDLVPSVPDHA
jgi:hypothetical protein